MPKLHTAVFISVFLICLAFILIATYEAEYIPAAVAGLMLMILVTWYLPRWQVRNHTYHSEKEHIEAVNELRRTVMQGFAGLATIIGLLIAAVEKRNDEQRLENKRIFDSTRTAADNAVQLQRIKAEKAVRDSILVLENNTIREKQINAQFMNAISLIKDTSSMTARVGGIHELARIAIDAQNYQQTIFEILITFVRDKRPIEPGLPDSLITIVPNDIQNVLTVLGNSKWQDTEFEQRDLRNTNLYNAQLPRANYSSYKLFNVNLETADLTRADLSAAGLVGTRLSGALLKNAVLKGANLSWANLRGANLDSADLSGAIMVITDLSYAKNLNANQLLSTSTLYRAILSDSLHNEMKRLDAAKYQQLIAKPSWY